MEQEYWQGIVKKINWYIQNNLLEGKTVFLFGHCHTTEKIADYLLNNKIHVEAIMDNNVHKQGTVYNNIPILNPNVILRFNTEQIYIFIASSAYEKMKRQCEQMGDYQVIQLADFNTYSKFSLDQETFKQKVDRVVQGEEIWRKINQYYLTGYKVVCPYNAMGDVYNALLYLPHYIRKNGLSDNCVLIVQGKSCEETCKLFGVENIVVINKRQMDMLVQFIIFTSPQDVIFAHHNRPYTNAGIYLSDYKDITFHEHYKIGIYGLSVEDQPVYPEIISDEKIYPQLKKGQSVILSPYAKSMVMLPSRFWEEKVLELKKDGWYVYTNIAANETPIKGTTPISYPISEMISVVEYAGYFIGIRSGLCDILSTARCKKEIVYPECIYSTTHMTVKEFFE